MAGEQRLFMFGLARCGESRQIGAAETALDGGSLDDFAIRRILVCLRIGRMFSANPSRVNDTTESGWAAQRVDEAFRWDAYLCSFASSLIAPPAC